MLKSEIVTKYDEAIEYIAKDENSKYDGYLDIREIEKQASVSVLAIVFNKDERQVALDVIKIRIILEKEDSGT